MKRSAAAVAVRVSSVTALCAVALGAGAGSKVTSLHAQLIKPTSDALFGAESKPPATPDEWKKLVALAADLVRGAKELESIESAKTQAEWRQFAHALSGAAQQAARAARAANQDALVSANGEIVSVCEDCHTKYRDAGRSMKE